MHKPPLASSSDLARARATEESVRVAQVASAAPSPTIQRAARVGRGSLPAPRPPPRARAQVSQLDRPTPAGNDPHTVHHSPMTHAAQGVPLTTMQAGRQAHGSLLPRRTRPDRRRADGSPGQE